MTKTLRLQTGLSSDASNSPTNIGRSNTGSDWVPFYVEEEKEESDEKIGFAEKDGKGNGGQGGVGGLQANMGDEPTSMEPGMLGNYIKPELPQLVPSRPPGLLPIPGRGDPRGEPAPPAPESSSSQDTKQVQAAMAMAAIYSQSPWAAIAMAQQRERLQQQMHATVPHPAAQAAAAAAAGGAARSLPPNLTMGLPGLPHMQGLPGAQQILEHSRQQDLIRDYLTKLAQSTLNVTTSMGTAPGPTSPQYLQSFSTSTTADSKTEKPLPATVRRSLSPVASSTTAASEQISSTSSRKSPPPPSMAYGSPYFPSASTASGNPYFNAMRHTSPTEPSKPMSTTSSRSPPSGGRRNGSSTNGREKVFTCNICNRSFGYKHVLQNHERTHTGEKPFECKECHKRFTRDHHLKTHMRLHTGEKPYNCTHCDRQFVQVANLRRHLRVHTGERPYKCELCPSNFSDSNQLKAHMLIHKGRLESAAASERRAAHAKATSEEEMRMRLKMILTPCTTEGASQRVADLHRPNFANLKEGLFFRHSLATGFPLPQYPPPPSLAALNTSNNAGPMMAQEEIMSQASLSPDSKDTESAHDSPGHGENLSDSNSEKRRSRKQKPRKMVWGSGEEGSPEEGDGSRERHVSSSSFRSHSMQQEPEDLSVRAKTDFEMLEDGSELPYVYRLAAAQAQTQLAGEKRNRSEGSDESLASFSDPQSSSLLKEEGTEEEKEMMEDDRGVSPPMSSPHPNLYSPFPIQLGLSGAAVPLSHEMREREGEIMAMVGKKQEISQQ